MYNPGQEQTVTTPDGKTWRLARLELRLIREFRDWISQRIGDPFETVDKYIDKLPADQSMQMIREAESKRDQLRSFSLGCDLAKQALATEEGQAELMRLLLLRHQPKATGEDGLAVVVALGEKLSDALEKASGDVPEGNGAVGNGIPGSTGTKSTAPSGTAGSDALQREPTV